MEVSVYNTITSEMAISQKGGELLLKAIDSARPSELIISFEGVKFLSSAFLNESIGKYAQKHKENIFQVEFLFTEQEDDLFRNKINDVIENALMGDEYSELIDNALASL